ncbi:MAG: hypothetical protein P8Y28_12780, partial [Gammaproteobacteria bacterium]
MKAIRYFGISLLIILGTQACTVTPKQADDATQSAKSADTAAPVDESSDPDVSDAGFPPGDNFVEELDTNVPPHLIYKLLVAEIAGQRGELNLAIDNYIDVAEETRDPRVAERATQIAMYAKEFDKALQASQFWVSVEPDNADARRSLA